MENKKHKNDPLNRLLYGHITPQNDANLCMVFFRRRCKTFIPTTTEPSRCFCGRFEFEHDKSIENRSLHQFKPQNRALKSVPSKLLLTNPSHDQSEHDFERWNVAKHTNLYPTNAYGIIEFENMLHPAKAHYLRLAYDTNPSQIVHLFTKQWQLQLPNLIVSIHGGIQNFELQPRLRQVLKRGLLKAAKTAGAWIFTSGINTGVVKHVGDALFMRSKIRSNIVVVGIAPWGVIQGREQLKGQNQTVSYHSAAVVDEDNCATLNSSHNCFLLVDNGTIRKYGGEVILRKRFEKYLSQQKISFHGHVGKQNIPVVCVVVEGGTNTIRTVLEYVTEEPPVSVVVIDGSGRAADLIAFTYKHIQQDGTLSPEIQEQLLNAIQKVFNYNRRQAENIYVELIVCMRKRQYITIYKMDDDASTEQEDVDQAILRTLLRNHKASALEQFRLTLSWNRPDIAQTCLLTKHSELTQAQLDVCMFEALVENRIEYVKLLIENGVSMKNFLTFNRLQALYNACGSNSTLHLIAKDVIRSGNHHFQNKVYSLYEIGLIIEKLIGQGYRSSYTRRTIRHYCARQPVNERLNFNVYSDAEQKEQYSQMNVTGQTNSDDTRKNSINEDPNFDFPYNELFVFAVLNKRHEMALFFWAHGEEALAKALIGCRLNKSLAREAQDDELDTDIGDEFLANAEDFQQRAVALLDQCYEEDDNNTTQILTCELENWSSWTCLDLSVNAYLRDFVAHKCCQQLLSDLWIGGMNVRKYLKWMVLLGLICPPALYLIDFKSPKELQLMPQTEEEYFQNEEDLFDSGDDSDDSSNKSSETSTSSSDNESPEPLNPANRDDEPSHDELALETNTLRRRRKKNRKKRRRTRDSSTHHADDPSISPNPMNTVRTDEMKLHIFSNELPPNHSSSPSTGIAISLDENDEVHDNHDMLYNNTDAARSNRTRFRSLLDRFRQTCLYRVFFMTIRRTKKVLPGYRCCKRTGRDTNSNETSDQISATKKIYEFFNAPVTKFIQDFVLFSVFLVIFTYVALIKTPPKPSICEWSLMFYLSTFTLDIVRELVMMNKTRWKTRLSVYFHDFAHCYETLCCLIFAIAFGLRLTSRWKALGRLLLCLDLSGWYLRTFRFLVVSKTVGPYIHIVSRNLVDLFRLIVIVIIVLMSFGVSRQAIKYPNKDWDWHSVKEVFLEPYFMIYGEVYAEKIDPPCNESIIDDPSCQYGHWVTPITMTAFLLVCNILLLSMLMAQFTSTFMRLSRLSDQVWKFQRYHTILQYEQKPVLAPPLVIISHIYILIKTLYRICRHRKRVFNRGLKLFLSPREIEQLRDFEEECVHEYLLAKEEKEKSTVEERMSTTSDRVSHMSTRVENLKGNATQQMNYFRNFDERLQRLEDMQSSTVQLLNALVKKLHTTTYQTSSSSESQHIIHLERQLTTTEEEQEQETETLHFSPISTPEESKIPLSTLLSSGGSRKACSSSGPNFQTTTTPPIIVNTCYSELLTIKVPATSNLTSNDERLGLGTTSIGASSTSLLVVDETSQQLYKAEETEHSIYGKLIKERFRKLSEVVEDIERTLPSHQQRQDGKHDKCDITDDDETLSTMDWVDTTTTGRIACNSTRISRFDINQEDTTANFIVDDHVLASDVLSDPTINDETKST